MSEKAIKAAIEEELRRRSKNVVNANAYKALFASLTNPIDGLGKIFLGREDALEAERAQIYREAILELLIKIDEAISAATSQASSNGVNWTTVSGFIEVNAENVDEVTGVDIPQGVRVDFEPGTHIRTNAKGARRATGLKIGGPATPKEEE